MNRTYTLRSHRPRSRLRRLPFFLLALALALFLIFNFQLYPVAAALAGSAVQNEAEALLSTAFLAEMAQSELAYTDLITLRYRNDGTLSTLSCDMPRLNTLRNRLMLALLSAFRENVVSISLPLGTVVGGDILSGRGPALEVRVLLARGASARIESEFTEVGINQSLHRVLFTVDISVTVMLPSRPLTVRVCESYPIAETVILGEVPDAYTEIHRLTEDVTEQDIDDIYDFGAHLP